MASILNIMNSLEQVEIGMMHLYDWFAEVFKDDPVIAMFFKEMSQEEKTHRGLVVFQKNIVRKNLKDFDNTVFDSAPLDAFNNKVRKMLDTKPSITLEDALDFAQKMESDACESMVRTLIIDQCPEVAPLIKNLIKNNEFHFDRLKKCGSQS